MNIKIIKCGKTVLVGGEIEAIITGICIRVNNYVTYEC